MLFFILTYIPSLIIEPTVVFAIRFRYTFTTKVIVFKQKLNNMPPRAALVVMVLATAITSGLGDTSIDNRDS